MRTATLSFILMAMIVLSGCNSYSKEPTIEKEDNWSFLCPEETEYSCGEELACEDKDVTFDAYIDTINIFKTEYESQEHIRFKVYKKRPDGTKDSIEILYPNIDSEDKLKTYGEEKQISIKGKIKGFDMPINYNCEQGIHILAEEINFK